MRPLHPFEIESNALALRLGTRLPKPRKLAVARPGFALGSCERLHFSPDGAHLVVVTANGTFLWDLGTGTRGLKLAVPSNPSEVVFSADGTQALVRNEQSQFVRLSLPDGAVLARFKAKHPQRMDGSPGLGPADRVLQLAYGGLLLELDGSDGTVRRRFPLDASGCSGECHWFPAVGCWIISQRCVADGRGRGGPGVLWHWNPESPEPKRLPGQWQQPSTARAPDGEGLLMHHVVEAGRSLLSRVDPATGEAETIGETPDAFLPVPSLAHDGLAFGVATDDGPYIDIAGDILRLPGHACVQFHPGRDLVGISGRAAFVAPRAALARQLPELQVWREERELAGRAYGRLSALGGTLPTRIAVFAREHEWLVQAERAEGRGYVPLADAVRVRDDSVEALCGAIEAMRESARAGLGRVEPATPGERRSFHGGAIAPPGEGWSRGVLIGFAPDACDIWPLKPAGATGFTHDGYPVAALPPDIDGAELVSGIRSMLAWHKPRRG